jgi:hypothetical protein
LAGAWGGESPVNYFRGNGQENDADNAAACLLACFVWSGRFLFFGRKDDDLRRLPEVLITRTWQAAVGLQCASDPDRDGIAIQWRTAPNWIPKPTKLALADAHHAAGWLILYANEIVRNLENRTIPDINADHDLFVMWGHLEWEEQQLPSAGYEPCYDRTWVVEGVGKSLCAHRGALKVRNRFDYVLGECGRRARIGSEPTQSRVASSWLIPFWTPEARRTAADLLPKLDQEDWNIQLAIEAAKLAAGRGIPPADDSIAGGTAASVERVIPTWNNNGELHFMSKLVKAYRKNPAPNQRLVLASFEEQDWPDEIDDPLPPGKLKDTLDGLKDSLGKGSPLIFTGDGTGKRIRWTRR